MNYYSASEVGKIGALTPRRIQQYCSQGRIHGAIKVGDIWFVPKNAVKPARVGSSTDVFPYISILDYVLKDEPANITEAINNLPEREKEIALCELAFVRGDFGRMRDYYVGHDLKGLGRYKFCVIYVALFDCLAMGEIQLLIDIIKIINGLLLEYKNNRIAYTLLKIAVSAFNTFCGFKSFEINIESIPIMPIETKKKILILNAYHYYLNNNISRAEDCSRHTFV